MKSGSSIYQFPKVLYTSKNLHLLPYLVRAELSHLQQLMSQAANIRILLELDQC